MSIIIENEYEGEINIPYEKIAHEVIEAAIDYVDCPYECEVNLISLTFLNTLRDSSNPEILSNGKSFCVKSPVMIALDPNPIRVKNIFI